MNKKENSESLLYEMVIQEAMEGLVNELMGVIGFEVIIRLLCGSPYWIRSSQVQKRLGLII
jgi:hypothetical protein